MSVVRSRCGDDERCAAGAAGRAKIVASEVSRKFLSSVLFWIGTSQCGRQVSSLLGRFVLDVTKQNEMLLNVEEGNMSSFQAACNFMKYNGDVWRAWIPPVQFRHACMQSHFGPFPRRPAPTSGEHESRPCGDSAAHRETSSTTRLRTAQTRAPMASARL
jgi:hypothetical protein